MGDPATKEMDAPVTTAPTPDAPPAADQPATAPDPAPNDGCAPGQTTASQHGDVLDI